MGYGKKAYNTHHLSWRYWYEWDNDYLSSRKSKYDIQCNKIYEEEEELYYGHKECKRLGIPYIAPNPTKYNNLEYSIMLEP